MEDVREPFGEWRGRLEGKIGDKRDIVGKCLGLGRVGVIQSRQQERGMTVSIVYSVFVLRALGISTVVLIVVVQMLLKNVGGALFCLSSGRWCHIFTLSFYRGMVRVFGEKVSVFGEWLCAFCVDLIGVCHEAVLDREVVLFFFFGVLKFSLAWSCHVGWVDLSLIIISGGNLSIFLDEAGRRYLCISAWRYVFWPWSYRSLAGSFEVKFILKYFEVKLSYSMMQAWSCVPFDPKVSTGGVKLSCIAWSYLKFLSCRYVFV